MVVRVEYEPEPDLYSILYPVIGEPPLLVGMFHDRLIWVAEELTAVRFVGELGTDVVGGGEEEVVGVADASFDLWLEPNPKLAVTTYVYVFPVVKPETRKLVEDSLSTSMKVPLDNFSSILYPVIC